jgi:hypothetical protein
MTNRPRYVVKRILIDMDRDVNDHSAYLNFHIDAKGYAQCNGISATAKDATSFKNFAEANIAMDNYRDTINLVKNFYMILRIAPKK